MAQGPSDTILVAIRITLRIRESKVRNPDPPDRRRFVLSEHIQFNIIIFLHIDKDILDRALREPSAKPRPLDENVTNGQSASQLQDRLPCVTSPCESLTTAVNVAERALTQNAELRRDLEAFLLPETRSQVLEANRLLMYMTAFSGPTHFKPVYLWQNIKLVNYTVSQKASHLCPAINSTYINQF